MIRYNFKTFRGDLFGGITAGIVALPLALAFGVASGAGAAAGLYGAIALGLIAPILGGTRLQISGPTGPMTVVIASALTGFSNDLSAIMAIIMLSGLFQVFLGFIGAGGLVRFMPYPVISGFMSGIGVIIIALQIEPILGSPPAQSPMQAVLGMGSALSHASLQSFILALLTIIIVFKSPKSITRFVPSPLIALVLVTLLSWAAGFSVKTIGDIPSTLPEITLPHFPLNELRHFVLVAMTLALLGSIDSLLTSLVSDSLTKERHQSNRELIGQGLGNLAAGLFGGIAGAGATMRTVINIKSGGVTRLSGVIHALFLLSLLLGLGPLISHIPMAVLSGILVKVGIDILDYRLLKVVSKAPKYDLYVMLAVLLITVFIDLIVAVAVGIVLSALFVVHRMMRQMEVRITGIDKDEKALHEELELQRHSDYQIRIVNIYGAFFFGTTSQVVDGADQLLGTRVLIFDCLNVPFMDISAVFAMEEIIYKLADRGIVSLLVLADEKKKKVINLGITAAISEDRIFSTQEEAIREAKTILAQPLQ